MSKLKFKGDVYTYKDILGLFLKGIEYYSKGEILDLETGCVCDISDIKQTLSGLYIQELLTERDKNTKLKTTKLKILKDKYENDIITKDEMFEFLKLTNQNSIKPSYNYSKGYLIVNLNKIPIDITDAEYGKFHKMLSYLSSNHYNRISHSNQHPIKKEDISIFLGYKKVEYLNKFLRKLKKHKLLDEQVFGGIKYIIINPAYAKRNMEIDRTIYKIFKDDLDDCLTKDQIYYLNMKDENIELDSMIPIED